MGRASGTQRAASGSESFTAVFGQRRGGGRPAATQTRTDPAPAPAREPNPSPDPALADAAVALREALGHTDEWYDPDGVWGISGEGMSKVRQAEGLLRPLAGNPDADEALSWLAEFRREYDGDEQAGGRLSEGAERGLELALQALTDDDQPG